MDRRVLSNTRTAKATATLAVVLAVAPSASGCSFLFSEGAPDHHRDLENFACGESNLPPIADTIAVGLLTFAAVTTASTKETTIAKADPVDRPSVRQDTNVSIGVTAVFAALSAAAAVYGYHAVSTCRGARAEREVAVAQARVLPPPYGVPPYGAPTPYWPPPPATFTRAAAAAPAPPSSTAAPPPATPSP
jgi:hypothetical protein